MGSRSGVRESARLENPQLMQSYLLPVFITLSIQTQVSLIVFTPPVLAPEAQFSLGIEAAGVGLITALIYLASVPATLVSGYCLDRIGAIRVSQVCIALTSLGMLLMITSDVLLIVLGSLIVGLGYGPITPASSVILTSSVPRTKRGFVFSVKQSGVPLGGVIAGLIIPVLMINFGWQVAGAVVSIIGLGLILVLNYFKEELALISVNSPEKAQLTLLKPIELVFKNTQLKELALSSGVFSGMQMSLGTFLVVLLTDSANFSITAAGGALSLAMIAGAIGRPMWGFLSDRISSPRVILGYLGLVMSMSAFTTSFVSEEWSIYAVYILSIIFGATAVGWNGVYLAAVANTVKPEMVGLATGGTLTVTYSGVVVVPLVFWGLYIQTHSYSLSFFVIGLVSLVRGILFFIPSKK